MKRVLTALTLVLVTVGTFQLLGQGGPPQQARGRAQALEAQQQRLRGLFEHAAVVFTDADENTGRLVVGVLDRDVEPTIHAWANALGVPFQAVDVVETDPIVQVATLRDQKRPVEGGLQIRFSQYVCSLSFNAVLNGVSGFVTASHCSTSQGTVDSTQYYQPLNQTPAEFIGQETVDPPFFKFGSCPKGKKCRYSDANFNAGGEGVLGLIAKTTGANNGSLETNGNFIISGKGTAVNGDVVSKVGRTTGWSQGSQTRTCVDTSVSGGNVLLFCQNFVQANVDGGDSGSPAFKISGDNAVLVGTLWGSTNKGKVFIYSPIGAIEGELGSLQTN